jgi:MFS family permease
MLGLGFTFFSGATEAWLVDALKFSGYKGTLDSVFAKGQVAGGIAMLSGSVLGGVVAQLTNLGVPYILRTVALAATFVLAYFTMKDWGFTPIRGKRPLGEMKRILVESYDQGLRKPDIKWIMLAGPFGAGVGFYAFYAMQPYLLQLYGNENAYGVAGLAAAIVGGAQIAGGLASSSVRKVFKRRTSIMATIVVVSSLLLLGIGLTTNFYVAVGLLVVWGLCFAINMPVRQAYLNGLIPSQQRATVLSTDNLISSTGGVVTQPLLGRAADVWGYGVSYIISASIQLLALPFVLMARRRKAESDPL